MTFKLKKQLREPDCEDIYVGQLLNIRGNVYKITKFKLESYPSPDNKEHVELVAHGYDVTEDPKKEEPLFMVNSFYQHLIDRIIRFVDDKKIQP